MKSLIKVLAVVLTCFQFNVMASDHILSRAEFKQDVLGTKHNLSAKFGKKPVVLVFFEPYSGYGLEQASRLYASFQGQVSFYGVAPAMNSTPEIAASAAAQHHIVFPVFFDESNKISRQLSAWQHPSFVVFDSRGKQMNKAKTSVDDIKAILTRLTNKHKGGTNE